MFTRLLLVVLYTAAVALAGNPLESGKWVEVYPSFTPQSCGGGVVNGSTFHLPESQLGSTVCGHMRAERRYHNDYTSGVHQFSGEFTVNKMTGSRIAIKQTFDGGNGRGWFLLAVERTGRLYAVGGTTIDKDIVKVGSAVRINTIHDAKNHRYSVYVNGKEMFRNDTAPNSRFYDKLGTYQTLSGAGDITVTWNNVQFWRRE